MADSRIGKTIGRYTIEQLLGHGGMAGVYRATDTQSGRSVAIKIMHPHLASQKNFQDAFMHEASMIARLAHPNIVKILAFERVNDELILAMEYVSGGNLRQYLKGLVEQEQHMPITNALDIVIQLANALNYAHQQKMAHRDVKPENIVLQPFAAARDLFPYRPIITDFGIARLSTSDENAVTDQPLGTYAYMSPEQCLAEKIDYRTDIYSLGIMLYELTVGQLPYKPQTIAEAARFHGREPLPLPTVLQPDFPPALEEVIVKALQKSPSDRYQSASDLSRALLSLRGGLAKRAGSKPLPIVGAQPITQPQSDFNPIDAPTQVDGFTIDTSEIEEILNKSKQQTDAESVLKSDLTPPNVSTRASDTSKNTYEVGGVQLSVYDITPPPATPDVDSNPALTAGLPTPAMPPSSATKTPKDTYEVGGAQLSVYDITPPPATPDIDSNPALTAGLPTPAMPPSSATKTPKDTYEVGGAQLSVYDITPPPTEQVKSAPSAFDKSTIIPSNEPTPAGIKPTLDVDAPTMLGDDDIPPSLPPAPIAPPPAPAKPKQTDQPAYLAPTGGDLTRGNVTERMMIPLKSQPPRMLKLGDNPPPSSTGDYLVCMNVLRHTFVFPLEKEVTTVGVARDQDIVLEAQQLSRKHLRIIRTAQGYTVVDVGSTNGTWSDDDQLEKGLAQPWDYGEIYRGGDYWFTILRGTASGETPQPDQSKRTERAKPTTVTVRKMAADEMAIQVNAPKPAIPANLENLKPPPRVVEEPKPSSIMTDVNPSSVPTPTGSKGFDDAIERTIISPEEMMMIEKEEEQPVVQLDKGMEGKIITHYRLDRYLGQGGIASVYAATDLRINRPVALKILHDSLALQEPLRKRFLEEARIASTLEHPNIVRVLSYDQTDSEVYLVMELIGGGSLRQYIRRLRKEDRVMNYMEAINFGRQIAEGLHYAHQQGLVHRDIKPDNIVLRELTNNSGSPSYQPVLTDFGLAQISANAAETFITDQPTVMFPYMSPEAVKGERVDNRSDVYEVGTILYELVVGQVPFEPRSLSEAIRMHTREPVARPTELRADIPRELERAILRCLEKDPNSRFQTAIELARSLESISKNLARQDDMGATPELVDLNKTQVMSSPIPQQMPYFTPIPVSENEIGYDRIVFYSEKYPAKAVRVDRDVLTIGRDNDSSIQLEGNVISRKHARIERFGNSYRFVDLGSRNGTWMGTTRLLPNVAEIWNTLNTIRLGDYWIKLESNVQQGRTTSYQVLNLTNLDDNTVPSREDLEAFQANQVAGIAIAPLPVLPAAQHDLIKLTVLTPNVTVQAGQTSAISIEIHNLSTLVDHFVIEVYGLPPEWVQIQRDPIYLLPNNRETASITLNPPLKSTSSAGAHAFEIHVYARAQGIKSVSQQCVLNILPFYNFKTNLYPQRIKFRGRVEVEITNTGNTFDTFTVQARDREQAIQFQTDGRQFTLPPGKTEYIGIRAKGRSRPFIGGQNILPFEVLVNSEQPASLPQTQSGEMVVKPLFPIWTLTLMVLLCGICFVLSLFGYTQFNNFIIINQTATVVAVQTSLPVTATEYALQDDDGDTLANGAEVELGTNPLLDDTDGDGLTDGEEVRIWRTDPLNPDTDGDTLTDGDEVKISGTNPLNPDTDGDDVPDNQDVAPVLLPTGTPTPFPTLVGTNGEICGGSPPTRLSAGIDARVEPGGVNNRLRDKPGVSDGAVIGLLPPGSRIRVIGGPECDTVQFLRWWQVVSAAGQTGWTAEGEGEEYYLGLPGGGGGGGGSAAPAGGGASGVVQNQTNKLVSALPPLDVSALDRSQMGIQLADITNTSRFTVALNSAAELKVAWVKVQISWADLQPNSPGEFTPTFQTVKNNLELAKTRGFKVMVSFVNAPVWSRALSYSQPGPPDDPQLFADFLTFFLAQTGTAVDAIEVWNEPNLKREWTGSLEFSGKGYMDLFKPAYAAIRQYSSSIVILTAGLAPTIDTSVSVDDRKFLRQMLDNGLNEIQDISVGIHPYGWANPPDIRCCVIQEGRGFNDNSRFYFLDNIEVYKTILDDYSYPAIMWITEFGYASWEGLPGTPPEPWYAYLTAEQQADFNLRAFQVAESLPYIGNTMLWNLNYASPDIIATGNPIIGFSIILRDGEQRPTFNRLRQ
jgi:serine/threonine protein kinase